MIIREATPADLKPLLAFSRKAWSQLGLRHDTDIDRFRKWARQVRIALLHTTGSLAAALAAHQIETDRGPGFEIVLFVVHPDQPDKVMALDALCLYALNIALSEGRRVVVSRDPKRTTTIYGRDMLGMEAEDIGSRVNQIGDARAMCNTILDRRPEWRTSL